MARYATTSGVTTAISPKRNVMNQHQPRSPSREEDNSIRRGAEIIRRQIQKQMLEMGGKRHGAPSSAVNNTSTTSTTPDPNSLPPRSLRKERRPWKEEFAWTPPERTEGTTKPDTIRDDLTAFSDPWKNQRDVTEKRNNCKRNNNNNAVEVDPPSYDADWSVDENDGMRVDSSNMNLTSSHRLDREIPLATPPSPPVDSPKRSTNRNRATPTTTSIYTFNDVDDDEGEENVDNDDDIMEVNEPMFDPFYENDLLPKENSEPLSLTSPLGTSFIDSIYTCLEADNSMLMTSSERQPPPESANSRSPASKSIRPKFSQLNPAGEYELAEQSMVRMTPEKADCYRLPQHLELPEKKKGLSRKLPHLSLIDFDEDDSGSDEHYESPMKNERPVSSVSVRSPDTVSQLSSPEQSTAARKPKSSVLMKQYDVLLRDPAYLHAQNAGFLWQAIVGQHVRFPSHWWNGARGPPIGEEDVPWMYFGRHTVKANEVLNQLVKCRASGGRLLLHIVVQDLMTRTPVQDIAIGCFHPNAKGIRQGDRAMKRLEHCRDVWMAVRKRSRQSVTATDSLLYSQSTLEGDQTMCRSPLGPGQRVTNHNVRSVFGDKAPLETIFLSEDELYERLSARMVQSKVDGAVSPPMAILQELVFA